MSQWNNSYAYNNQHQDANNWEGDMNGQYANQVYYPNRQYDSSNQYVSFNEFLSQMQPNDTTPSNAANYNNAQYQQFDYNYQNMPSSSQNTQGDTYYETNSSNGAEYNQNQYSSAPPAEPTSNYTNNSEVLLKSNLTATATEFVPKRLNVKSSASVQNIPEASSSAIEVVATEPVKVQGSSSDVNWRERRKPSQNGESSHRNDYNKHRENYRYNDTKNRNREGYRDRDSNRDYDRESNRARDRDSNNDGERDNNSDRNQDYNSRYDSNQESNSRNDRNQTKSNYKSKKKEEADAGRTFYNSRNPGGPEERSRNGKEGSGRGRNWAGSQRIRASDRNYSEDEQYASNYLQYRDEIPERNRDERPERNRAEKTERYRDERPDRYREDRPERYREDRPERYRDGRSERYRDDRPERNRDERPERYRDDRPERNRDERPERYRDDRNRDERTERPSKMESSQSPAFQRNKNSDQDKKRGQAHTEMTQRERLSEQLDKGTLECLVCCERVKQVDPVWSCTNCYHVLHLRCIRKWAMSSMVDGKWRCPACQNTSEAIPTEYRCMCGAIRSPEYVRGSSGAHTCGKSCKRPRNCPHPCTLLCHPGPCPPCQATVNKQCGCGAETRSVLCSSKLPQVCGRRCRRALACEAHSCDQPCHEGDCAQCQETVTQVCYCPSARSRVVACSRSARGGSYACGAACGRVLACGQHVCDQLCHPPPCDSCKLLPENVATCPCGKRKLEKDKRKSCTDPIPLCGNICAKPLQCGPAGDKHFCKIDCHEGPCPTCPDKTLLQCRCGHSSREVPCADLPEMYNNVLCQKKCNKKLSCGRHRCRATCCAATTHRCTLVCGRSLTCQLHRCENFCHSGHCAPCPNLSWDELRCSCGREVLLPPVRCGARPPACTAPCSRARPCGHDVLHACHAGDCPPCVVLTTKRCHGGHEERKTIPCSQDEFSCGLPCGKPLPCGKHTCIKTCHKGPCDTSKCTQPCNEKRPSCGHPCAAPCHRGVEPPSACPSAAPCRKLVRATCLCGRKHADRACADNARDVAKIMSAMAATKIQEGGSVDLSDVQRPGNMLKTLECDDACRMEARARQLALALQIRNPDVSAKLAPRYSDGLRSMAQREPAFATQVHDQLTQLVHKAKKSKQKTRSHSFPSMNWQKRQFIHEMCEHFGCESVAYDAEPNRNVVATADREKSWLPAMSILEVVSREAGKRRVPGPVLRAPAASAAKSTTGTNAGSSSGSGWATLTSTNAWAARSNARQQQQQQQQSQQQQQQTTQPTAATEKIDYFDNPPEN